jgi:hypothetical protein
MSKGQKDPAGSSQNPQNSAFDQVEKLNLMFFDSFFPVIKTSASF